MPKDPFISVKVGDLMTKMVVSIDATGTANEVAKLMLKHKIDGFPVTENDKLVGIFTSYDVRAYRELVQRTDLGSLHRESRHRIIPVAKPLELEATNTFLPGRITTGYSQLDSLLLGGIPENYAVILTSPPCDERDSLIQKYLETGAKRREVTFYLTINPFEMRTLTEELQSQFYLFSAIPRQPKSQRASSTCLT